MLIIYISPNSHITNGRTTTPATTKSGHLTNPPYMQMSPALSQVMDALTQILMQVIQTKQDNTNKRLVKNIKIFDGTNKFECINWLTQVEAAA